MTSRKSYPKNETIAAADEQTFRLLFLNHPIPMAIFDLKTLAFLQVNKAAVEQYGYSRAEFQALTLKDILSSEDIAYLLENAKKDRPPLKRSGEWRNRLKDGRFIDVEVTSLILKFEGREAVLVMTQDITERKQAEERLTESEAELRALFASMKDAVLMIDRDGVYRKIAPTNPGLLVKPPDELIGKNLRDFFPPEQAETFITVIRQVVDTQQSLQIEYELPIEERMVWFSTSISPMDADSTLWVARNVTERKHTDAALHESEERYHTLFDRMMDGIYRSTHEGRFVDVNPAMVKMFGYASKEEMLAVDIKKELYFAPEERGSHILDTGQEETEVYRMRRKDGSEIWVEDHGYYVHDEQGRRIYHEGMLRDITQRKQAEDELRHAKDLLESAHYELQQSLSHEQLLARTDSLTGLYNRRQFFELAEREFTAAVRYQRPLSILMFDADEFKQVNDIFGHAEGDKALEQIAQIAAAQVRAVDVLARYGGDEFVLLLPQADAQQALLIAERIRANVAVATRVGAEQSPFVVTLSIGIADLSHTPADESIERVIQRADKALYDAKTEGRNRTKIFDLK